MKLQDIAPKAALIKENIEKVLIGKGEVIDLVLTSLLAGGHVLLEDVPGTGKTMLARSLACSLDADFKRIQFTPDLLPSDITGLNYYNQKEGEFVFRKGPVFTNLILADEINRATPRTQSSLLECMEERQVTIDGLTRKMETLFFVIATENPIETVGTFPLPEAQLDRFMMKLKVGFPSLEGEQEMLNRFQSKNPFDELQSVCTCQEIIEMQQLIKTVYVHPLLQQYIVKIVNTTRNHENILSGVSPRGSLNYMRAAQSYAAIQGRAYVTPEDVKYLAVSVLAHRLVMRAVYDESQNGEFYINQLIKSVEVPVENFKNE